MEHVENWLACGAFPRSASAFAGSRGFTLAELVVVMAIAAILAAVALPSYRQYVVRGQLNAAYAQLGAIATSMQQYYQDNRTFLATGASTPPCTSSGVTIGKFTYSCPETYAAGHGSTSTTATTFVAVATGSAEPVSGFVFTIDDSGVQTTAAVPGDGWTLPIDACWVRNVGGQC